MSQVIYRRGDLYEKYKESDPELAEKFYGDKHPCYLGFGATITVVGIGSMVICLIVCAALGLMAENPGSVFGIQCGCWGAVALPGIILLAIWYCKRRNILNEMLSVERINFLAGKVIKDPLITFNSL